MRKLTASYGFVSALSTVALAFVAAACSDHPFDDSGPAIDPNAPRVHILQPARGTILGAATTVTVSGTAEDDSGVAKVTVNGVDAKLAADGSFTVEVPVTPGTNLLHAIATDASNNAGKETRAVVAGPMTQLDMAVPNALTASLSAQTFDAVGRGISGFLTTADLEALIAPMNPVINSGAPDGPDCLYVQGAVTSAKIGGSTTTLTPQSGSIAVDLELSNVKIGMHLNYAAACLDGSRDVTAAATNISVKGTLVMGVKADHTFDVHLDNPVVKLTGFDVDLGGIPGAIVNILHLDSAASGLVASLAKSVIASSVGSALSGLNNTKTIDVLGTPVDIAVAPQKIDIDTTGALIQLDTTLRAHGDDAGPGFVYIDNQLPTMDRTHGFAMAVADDAANQLFASFWAAKGMDKTIDLKTGPYGDVGTLYDSVQLQAMVPPFVDATGEHLSLTIGDLLATFSLAGSPVTSVAINAQVDLQVKTDDTGAIRLDVGTPTTYVDILDDQIEGANALSTSQFEAITSFALGRVIAFGSGAVGAIPLPSMGGVSISNLDITEQTGYLVVGGEVK